MVNVIKNISWTISITITQHVVDLENPGVREAPFLSCVAKHGDSAGPAGVRRSQCLAPGPLRMLVLTLGGACEVTVRVKAVVPTLRG